MSASKGLVEPDADTDEAPVGQGVNCWPESDHSGCHSPDSPSIVIPLQTEGTHVDIGHRWPSSVGRQPVYLDYPYGRVLEVEAIIADNTMNA